MVSDQTQACNAPTNASIQVEKTEEEREELDHATPPDPPAEVSTPEGGEGVPPVVTETNKDDQAAEQLQESSGNEGEKTGEEATSEPSEDPKQKEAAETEGVPPSQAQEGEQETETPEEREREKPREEETKQEAPGHVGSEEGAKVEVERPTTKASARNGEKKEKKEKKREKQKDKEKKQKRKTKQAMGSEEVAGAVPKSRPRATKPGSRGRQGTKQVEVIMLSMFQPFDPDGTGYVDPTAFWEVSLVVIFCTSTHLKCTQYS